MAEALLIIDFQNDFTPGGALAVEEATRSPSRFESSPNASTS